MEAVIEHIKGDRQAVLKCGLIASEVALGQKSGAAACIPIVASSVEVHGLVLGLNMNHLPSEIQDLAIALAIKLGMTPEMAAMLRPVKEETDEVSYRIL